MYAEPKLQVIRDELELCGYFSIITSEQMDAKQAISKLETAISKNRQHTELRGHPSVHQGRDVGRRRINSMTQNFSEGSKQELL